MSLFCFQCGVLHHPEPAIGVDEDGEPACAMHREKLPEPEVKQPPTSTQENTMLCKGFDGKSCDTELPGGNTTGLCTRCYARMMYRKHHPKSESQPRKQVMRGKRVIEAVQNLVPKRGDPIRVGVMLTIPQLDLLWALLSYEVKARLLESLS